MIKVFLEVLESDSGEQLTLSNENGETRHLSKGEKIEIWLPPDWRLKNVDANSIK